MGKRTLCGNKEAHMKFFLGSLKAWVGALLAALALAAQDSAQTGGHLTLTNYLYIAGTFVGTFATIYGIGNALPAGPLDTMNAILQALLSAHTNLQATLRGMIQAGSLS